MIPEWLEPVRRGAESITVHELTRFMPPEGSDPRRGAVLILFGEGENGPDLLLTERSHTMRSHPGQVSFPGGSIDPDESPQQAALREGEEEVGLDPASVEVFAELPELWLPPSNFAVTSVIGWWAKRGEVSVASPDEVHAIHHVPIADLVNPAHRATVRHPVGFSSPGFLIGANHDVVLWGFTAGIISRLFEFVGWANDWDTDRTIDLPAHMIDIPAGFQRPQPNTNFVERPGR